MSDGTCPGCEGPIHNDRFTGEPEYQIRGVGYCEACFLRRAPYDAIHRAVWESDPSRCGAEDCLSAGTELRHRPHYTDTYFCPAHAGLETE